MGAAETPCWPRGYPISKLHDNLTNVINVTNPTKFAVFQSLADIEPDVDAMYRMTQHTPFIFKKGKT